MKREAVSHTKMKRLCRRMDIPVWQGVGLLESLWHLTAREAPDGAIGKLSDEDIALGIDYRGDEAALIECLVSSGWMDRNPDFRLVIHDWQDHADDAVHLRLARARAHFSSGRAPNLTRLGGKERERAHEFYTACAQNGTTCAPPEPEPEPEPERMPSPKNGSGTAHGSRFSLDELPHEWEQWGQQTCAGQRSVHGKCLQRSEITGERNRVQAGARRTGLQHGGTGAGATTANRA